MSASSLRQAWSETAAGPIVVAATAGLLAYGLSEVGARGAGSYDLVARFGQASALAPDASVRVAGMKVGAVDRIDLDPKTFLAVVHLSLQPDLVLPSDSTAKITADGLPDCRAGARLGLHGRLHHP